MSFEDTLIVARIVSLVLLTAFVSFIVFYHIIKYSNKIYEEHLKKK